MADEDIVQRANAVFGYRGWSSQILDVSMHSEVETAPGAWRAGAAVITRVTLVGEGESAGWPYREKNGSGVGFGAHRAEAV
eukprot:CAMPEP_0119271738 /NCGR_PEP_ID=MMETSP1329-20130426/8210_1 /TAXON_ID=114041 /ORGANISM="Genus nov. species nov., Strain RCC1024" /LENGTH=80 /DNA_ID=CAMNT_0007271789 /DNA_START=176 /DNA_END=415 /DNA_ORIENTATION=+